MVERIGRNRQQVARCDDIDFVYPTQRYYNNILEGKTAAGSPLTE